MLVFVDDMGFILNFTGLCYLIYEKLVLTEVIYEHLFDNIL